MKCENCHKECDSTESYLNHTCDYGLEDEGESKNV